MRGLEPRPDPLPLFERLMSHCVRAPLIFAATAFWGSLSLSASLVEKDGKWQHRIAQAWGRTVTAVSGAKLTVVHPERLKRRVAVYACNHLSYMDTPVIFGALPFQFRIVARHDLWKMPFVGWHLRRSGQVPVNVNNPRASISSLSSAARALKTGMPLFIFPEGGRSESGHVATFMNGPAFMAIRAQVPLVPIALIGTFEMLPIHTAVLHPVPVTLVVGEPIETAGCTMKQVNEITARLAGEIARMYYEHSYLRQSAPAQSVFGAALTEPAAVSHEVFEDSSL
jgi:1-acyl-sn-glycerol-3-phosphate acyltransferase